MPWSARGGGLGREDLREELVTFMNDALLPRLEDRMQQLLSSDKACPTLMDSSADPVPLRNPKKQVSIGRRCLKSEKPEQSTEPVPPGRQYQPAPAPLYSSEQEQQRQMDSTNSRASERKSWRFSQGSAPISDFARVSGFGGLENARTSRSVEPLRNSSYVALDPCKRPSFEPPEPTDDSSRGEVVRYDSDRDSGSSEISEAVSFIELEEKRRSCTPWQQRVTLSRLSGELFDVPERRNSMVVTTLMNVVMDSRFTYGVGGCIILNAITMGVQADYMAHHWDEPVPDAFLWVDSFFCSVFVLELVMRVTVYAGNFLTMQGWQWNLFDICMVAIQVTDLAGALFSDNWARAATNAGVLRMMRIFRLFRVLRLVRVLSVFAELRMFIVSVSDAMRSLFWTMVIICLCMYIGGLYLTQLLTDLQVQHPEGGKEMAVLKENYGSLTRSMLTLYMTISEGIPWSEAMEPWYKYCGSWISFAFALWMAFTLFALMNVITGVFVESAIRTANDDKKKLLIYQMGQWFLEADVDQSETINWLEFARHLENPKMERFLKTIDIDVAEAGDLFTVLDVHEEGEIHVDDFVNGCIRLLGSAKSIDLITVLKLQKRAAVEFEEQARKIDGRFDDIEQRLNSLQSM